MVAVRFALEMAAPPMDVASARAEVERLRTGLPDTLLATRPEELRRLARRALDADRAAMRRRGRIGEEPVCDGERAAAAIDAHAAVRAARRSSDRALRESMQLLGLGNAWGVAAIATAGVMVVRNHMEPMAAPVFFAMAGSAAGPLATAAVGLVRRSAAATRLYAANVRWAGALQETGFETMGELKARLIAVAAWRRRVSEADAATGVARDARAAWHRVAGPKRHPREAPALIAQLSALRAAQLELLRALLDERVNPPAPPRPSLLPVPWVPDQPVIACGPAVADEPSGEHWLGDALSRLKGRGLRLWTR